MTTEQEFLDKGFSVHSGGEKSKNEFLSYIRKNHPNVIKDGEINLQELKKVLGLPIDEKVNGYGLNFVGRNVARAKYAQETEMELLLNKELSKNIDTTKNLVITGDNIDSLKILRNYYMGKIKWVNK